MAKPPVSTPGRHWRPGTAPADGARRAGPYQAAGSSMHSIPRRSVPTGHGFHDLLFGDIGTSFFYSDTSFQVIKISSIEFKKFHEQHPKVLIRSPGVQFWILQLWQAPVCVDSGHCRHTCATAQTAAQDEVRALVHPPPLEPGSLVSQGCFKRERNLLI